MEAGQSEEVAAPNPDRTRKEAEEKFMQHYAEMSEEQWLATETLVTPYWRSKVKKARADKKKKEQQEKEPTDSNAAWREALKKEEATEKKLKHLKQKEKDAKAKADSAAEWLDKCKAQLEERGKEREELEQEFRQAQAETVRLHVEAKGDGATPSLAAQQGEMVATSVEAFLHPIADKLNQKGAHNPHTAQLWSAVVGALGELNKACAASEGGLEGMDFTKATEAAAEGARRTAEEIENRMQEDSEKTAEAVLAMLGSWADPAGGGGENNADGAEGSMPVMDPKVVARIKAGKAGKEDTKLLASKLAGVRKTATKSKSQASRG